MGEIMEITTDLVEKSSIKLLFIGITTAGAVLFDIFGQVNGVSIFAPLLFFLPIILAAYWFPQKGVLFAVGIGILSDVTNNYPVVGTSSTALSVQIDQFAGRSYVSCVVWFGSVSHVLDDRC